MAVPFQLVFQDFPPSPAVESRIQEEVGRLDRYRQWVTNCRVVVGEPHRSRQKGRLFEVHVYLPLADGGEIVVTRNGRDNHAHEDVYIAIRDAFQAAMRQLRVHIRKKRHRDTQAAASVPEMD